MTLQVVVTAYGRPALDALNAAVREAKTADPMTLVTVVAPTNLSAIVARRHLAAGAPGQPGIAGVEVSTLKRLAERIALPHLTPRRPITQAVLSAAWRAALAREPRAFSDIASHPATVRALVQAHTRLRDLSVAGLGAVASSSDVAYDVAALHSAVCRQLGNTWYDDTDVLCTAAANVADADLGVCVLYLPQDLDRAEQAFVSSLKATADLVVVHAKTGAQRADYAVEAALQAVSVGGAGALSPSTATQVINASDSDDEVRCVVRDLVERLVTTPAHRTAILYASLSPYARLLHEQLSAAGVTVNGAGVRSTDERGAARLLLETLALADRDLPRANLFQAMANAPSHDFTGERIPLAAWERISRSSGVVAGDDWQRRLDAFIEDRHAMQAVEEASDDPRDWLAERFARDATAAERLRDFSCRLRDELRGAEAMTTWRDLADWAVDLFTTLIGGETDLNRLPREEQYAAAAVLSTLAQLGSLDSAGASPSFDAFREVLDAELSAALPRVGRFGEGVLVAPISSAIGLELDVIYIVGLSEDLFPGKVPADALLPDAARAATHGELPPLRRLLDTKYRQLLAAFASAKQTIVSFPRGDLRRSSRRLPSRFLLPTLRVLCGDANLAATDWDRPTNFGDAMTTSGSFAGQLLASRPATEQEWRTRAVVAGMRLDDEIIGAAVEMIYARNGETLTRYDGMLGYVDGLPDYAVDGGLVSPTALESYVDCPHGFFVQRLLKVEPIEQPEEIIEISPMEIGNLIHESVDELVTGFGGSLPGAGEPWSDAQHQRLIEIAVAKADEFRERGLTGHPRLWERERDRILADIEWLLADDDHWRSEGKIGVAASELPFGLRGAEPVEVPIANGRVLMRGAADKVDIAADGTIHVTDIKTGSRRKFDGISEDDPLAGGARLQLPVYAYAARARFGDADTPVHASYWFVRKDRGRLAIQLTPEVEGAYARTLSVIVRSISAGLFPPKAPKQPDFAWVQCPYCNPDGIGHQENRRRWEKKRHDPVARELVELIDPDALAGGQQ